MVTVRHDAPMAPFRGTLAALVALAGTLTGCGGATTADRPVPAEAPPGMMSGMSSAGSSTGPRASEVLAGLAVKGRAPATGYERDKYGKGWADEDGDGCSTREEILQRDLTNTTFQASGRCELVAHGTLADPYSGRTITFTRGGSTSSAIQIDHVVALADSWQKGAQTLSSARRRAFANDPLNLLAVDGPLNQGKGAGDAATWLPPNRGYRCAYVARQVAVKAKYGLWVTSAEKAAISEVLTTCP
ncbi:MAG: hypothetical protein QG622_2159, partial [Actinomycetota bacterium]|nr:hypothetical protein [Actinomycetota bacterium]